MGRVRPRRSNRNSTEKKTLSSGRIAQAARIRKKKKEEEIKVVDRTQLTQRNINFAKYVRIGGILRLENIRNSSIVRCHLSAFLEKNVGPTKSSEIHTEIIGVAVSCDNSEIFGVILSELTNCPRSKLQRLEVDSWGLRWTADVAREFLRFLKTHGLTLRELKLRCRLLSSQLIDLLSALPPYLFSLDISESIFENNLQVASELASFVGRSPFLRSLRMHNCGGLSLTFRSYLTERVESLGACLGLTSLEGIDFRDIADIPKRIRTALTNKSDSSPLLEYWKDRAFGLSLLGKKVRVWWPPSQDPRKSDFSGRYWPGICIRFNPAEDVFSIRYDNGEIENVSPTQLQPFSLYEYGGGLHFDQRVFDPLPLHKTKRLMSSSGSPRRGKRKQRNSTAGNSSTINEKDERKNERISLHGRRSGAKLTAGSPHKTDGCEEKESQSLFWPPFSEDDLRRAREQFLYYGGTSSSSLNRFLVSSQEDYMPPYSVDVALHHPLDAIGSILEPGEICEFFDPQGYDGSDPNDFLGVVKEVLSEEPIYRIQYVFQDDDEPILLPSRSVRRAVIISYQEWRDWALLNERCQQNRFVLPRCSLEVNSEEKRNESDKMKSTKTGCCCSLSIFEKKKRSLCPFYHLCINCSLSGAHPILCPFPPFEFLTPWSSLGSTSKPPDLLNWPHTTPTQHLLWVKKVSHGVHPRIAILREREKKKTLPKKSLAIEIESLTDKLEETSIQMAKMSSLMKEVAYLRSAIENAENKVSELEADLNCIVCLERRRNCVLRPCLHWQFCSDCAGRLSHCPVCRKHSTNFFVLKAGEGDRDTVD